MLLGVRALNIFLRRLFDSQGLSGVKKDRTSNTCCHDDTRQDFPSRMRGREVVREFAEFIHDETRDGICQHLRWQKKKKERM